MTIDERLQNIEVLLQRRTGPQGDSRNERRTADTMRGILQEDAALSKCYEGKSDDEIVRIIEDFVGIHPEQFAGTTVTGSTHPDAKKLRKAMRVRCHPRHS